MWLINKIITIAVRALILMLVYNFSVPILIDNGLVVEMAEITYKLSFAISLIIETVRLLSYVSNKNNNEGR